MTSPFTHISQGCLSNLYLDAGIGKLCLHIYTKQDAAQCNFGIMHWLLLCHSVPRSDPLVCICSTPGLGSIELPDSMSKLTLLRRLILSGWCYSTLPGVVGRLSHIQELDFRFVGRVMYTNPLYCMLNTTEL